MALGIRARALWACLAFSLMNPERLLVGSQGKVAISK